MAQDQKVLAALRDAEYYRDGDNDTLKNQFMEEQTITLAGKSYTLSKISYLDVKIFALEMDSILVNQNPLIHEIYAKYATNIFDLIRMVNLNSKQGFKGALASGNELDVTLFNARQFYDPDNSTNKRVSWVRTVATAPTTLQYFEGATAGVELTMGEEEGMLWLAFYNPATQSCVDAFQVTMNTEPYDIQSLDFEQFQTYQGDPIIEFKEPWTLPPEQSGEMSAYYFRNGTDEMRPIGVWIKMAKNLRALGTP